MNNFTEITMRPTYLDEYMGQDKIKEALSFYIQAAKLREECLDHTIIYGYSGLGKTTLAHIIANEMEQRLVAVSAPAIRTIEDMRAILLNLEEGDILFIDEIHRLSKRLEEILYFAMEDFLLDISYNDMRERIELTPFTLIGATTSRGMLSEPLRNRFHITLELTPYSDEHLTDIVRGVFERLNLMVGETQAYEIAKRGRGIPRIVTGFCRRIADFAIVESSEFISDELVQKAFSFLDIDENGLTAQDRRYLYILGTQFGLRPVGIETLCSALCDDRSTIENSVEPYLIQKGYVYKTPRGRVLSELGINLVKEME